MNRSGRWLGAVHRKYCYLNVTGDRIAASCISPMQTVKKDPGNVLHAGEI